MIILRCVTFFSDPINRESCDIIESALYGICLDEGNTGVSNSPVSYNYYYWILMKVNFVKRVG